MDEWGDLDARLERKKYVKLRRQQREIKKQQKELDALEKERKKLMLRCTEMAREDALSIAMMRFCRQQERQQRREIQRDKDLIIYAETAKVRQRAQQLGLSLETRGVRGKERGDELRHRIEKKEAALESAAHAKQRLDALPQKRSRVRKLLESFFASSTRAKLERAVYESRCESIVALLDQQIPTMRCDPSLLEHESQNGLTPMLCAIYQGKLALVRRLLELGAPPDGESQIGVTPLLACVLTDNVVALSMLVEFHVNLLYETSSGVKALLFAADKGRDNVVKTLLRLGVNVDDANTDGRTPLMQAVLSGHYETIKILLAFNAGKNALDGAGCSALVMARRLKFDHIVALLSGDASSKSLLTMVQEQDERAMDAPNRFAQEVIKHQSKAPGRIAMEMALHDGDVGRILELLSVDDIGYGPNTETSTGATPLLVVSEKGTRDDILYCLERRCAVTHCNGDGVNALMKAAYHGKREVLELLIRAGCSLWSPDIRGHDTLRYLHDFEHHDLVTRLTKLHDSAARPRLHLSQPLEDVDALRFPGASKTDEISVPDTPSGQPHHSWSGKSEDECQDGVSDNSLHHAYDLETANEWTKSHKWHDCRHVLRRDTKRHSSFEAERHKIGKYAERGRRNGLIAPLPHDKAGRLKFPTCDNCHGNRARKRCFLCDQVLCDSCHARLHELPHRQHHEYEELAPTLMVGTQSVTDVVANQEGSLQGILKRSISCVETIKHTMLSSPAPVPPTPATVDLEVERYQRKQRAFREKEIASMQTDVPVSAAKHAIRAGEGDIYTNPTELELVDLYITQVKLIKARALVEATKQTVEDSLGSLHPTMLKIYIRLVRIDQQSGDLERGITTLRFALAMFESAVAPDSNDLIAAHGLGLQILDTLADYTAAVELCRRIYRLRVVGLPRSHELVQQARKDLDAFIAKRETNLMSKEDLFVLERAAMNAEQAEAHRIEQERKRTQFCTMLLDQKPPDRFVSFLSFAKKEFAEEMVHFWIAVETAKSRVDEQDAKAFRAAIVAIFVTYIKSRRVKIITAVQRKKMKKVITTPGKKIPRTIFDEVQALVFEVVYNRVYVRFETEQPQRE